MLKPGDPDYEFERREELRQARRDKDIEEFIQWCKDLGLDPKEEMEFQFGWDHEE